MKELIPLVDIPPTKENVKMFIWKPIMKAAVNKSRTRDLSKEEVNKIYEIVNRYLAQQKSVEHVPFPSEEDLIEKG